MKMSNTIAAVLLISLVAARAGIAQSDHYEGISSASTPTGSAAIASRGLVAAYDMESRTSDGELRDFSGNGHHATFSSADLIESTWGGVAVFEGLDRS